MTVNVKKERRRLSRVNVVDQAILQFMALCGVVYMIVFYYSPMYGIVLAFKDYKFFLGIGGSEWVGFENFIELFTDVSMGMVLRNTIMMSLLKILICFPIPILFAVLLSEFQLPRFKRIVQTASYFPHFISWVIVSLMITYLFTDERSLMNTLLMSLGLRKESYNMLNFEENFYWICVVSETWKEMGWSSIIFLAAISGIDREIYEAATVDGASRLQKIRFITLPNLTGAIVIMFMFSFSGLLSGGGGAFDQSYFLGNSLNYDRSIILSTYTLEVGISLGRFSYATAVGLVNSIVSMLLLLTCNEASKKFLGRSLYIEGDY